MFIYIELKDAYYLVFFEDFFVAMATKQPGDPSEGCITLNDFLNIKLWFDKIDGKIISYRTFNSN